ncbi:SDR family NAD(P)-dependent oxidoreductase [Bacillus sp. FJAT-29814]|uniref:SDR family NAD(P)-dependent oxidoreductase n=1 Tax=Bacillus sp. FJAT-29814 TaxID=1729688 RepID=UPI00082D7843|nr:SDR family oxidoreductase [Bacillus sp. FJAT-29814]
MFELDVNERNVVVTGGSSGIGLAISKAFLQKGANVSNWDIHLTDEVKQLLDEYPSRFQYLEVDVIEESSIIKAMENTWGTVDVLINNAGIISKSPLESIRIEDWNRIYDINVRGTMLVTKNLVWKLRKSGTGRVINLSSMTAKIGLETYSLYSSTKAAVSNLTKVWALELAKDGITVNALCPGWADTAMKEKLVQGIAGIHNIPNDEAEELILEHVPQKRFIHPEEIAFCCLFIASTLAGAISGQELFIDTGLTNMFKPGVHATDI